MRKKFHARRGTSIAAAALSLALVSPMVQPVAFAADAVESAAAAAGQDRAPDTAGTSEDTAIRADGIEGEKQTYSGEVYLDRDGYVSNKGKSDEAMAGVKVFLQYINGKGQVSPIYYTVSDTEGKFTFGFSNPPKDGLGNPIEWKLVGDDDFLVRTWAENPDPAKYTLAAGGDMYNGRFHGRLTRKQEAWNFTAGINRISGGIVAFQERPNTVGWLAKPEAEWVEAPTADKVWPDGGNYGAARGTVWWENNEAGGTLAQEYYKGRADRGATGVKVVGSYVNDEVARQLDAWKKANKNYTREQFRVAQTEIIEAYQAENGVGSHIAETRVAYVQDDGSYYLPFAGLYGSSSDNKGNKVTDDQWGTLVTEEDEAHDRLMQWNGTLGQLTRHVNTDYMYIYPVVGDNRDIWMNTYQDNMFQEPNDIAATQLAASNNINFQNFAILTPRPNHNVVNYDNASEIAGPGDVATSKTTGLVPNETYAIKWVADGEDTGTVCTVTANELGELDSCDFKVPENLDKPTVYTSQVYAAGADGQPTDTMLLADSFLADPTVVNYPETTGKTGEKDLTSTPSFDNPATPDTVEAAPLEPKFEFVDPAAAEALGMTIDPNTGVVTWPADKQVAGVKEVMVKASWKPAEGADERSREVPVKFNLEASDATVNAGEDQTVVEGTPIKNIVPEIENQPEGGSVEVSGLPNGVTYDEATGTISGTPTVDDWGADEETRDFTVKVEVKDADGKVVATDEVVITVQRDTDRDGDPDVTDPDDDGDGYTDEEEKEAGTDPKDPDSKPAAPGETTVNGGADQTVIEGNAIETIDPKVENLPEGGSVDVTVPEGSGLTVNPDGTVSGTPTVDDWGADEETREITVKIEVKDADGKVVATDEVVITVQRDTDRDGDPDVTDPDDDGDGYTDEEEKEAGTDPKDPDSKPSTPATDPSWPDTADTTPGKPAEVEKEAGSGDVKPGTTVEVVEGPGTATIDEETGKVTVTPGDDAKPGDKIVVEVKDPDGKVIDTITIEIKKDGSSLPTVPGSSEGSSNLNKKCLPALAGAAIPLLFLIPVGLAAQGNIPGLEGIQKQIGAQINDINKQITDANTSLQKQLGIFNGDLARQAQDFNAQLGAAGQKYGKVAGGVAIAAAGILALGFLLNSCLSPDAGSSNGSSN